MRPLFYSTLMRNLADLLVGIFLPLFLFGIGQKLELFAWLKVTPFVSGVLFTIVYYALQRLTMVIIAFPTARLLYHLGYVKSMVLGTIFLGLNFVGLYLAKFDPHYLIASAIFGGLFLFCYWPAHDSLFALEINVKEIGRGIGALAFLTKLIQIATPAAAGIVIALWGYQVLFVAGLAFLIVSILPLMYVPSAKIIHMPNFSQFVAWVREFRFRKFALVQVGSYMDTIAILLWPIFVLVVVGKIQQVGFLYSLALFLSLVLTYLAGWFVDHKKGKRIYVASGAVISLSWLMRLFVHGFWDILGVQFLEQLAGSVYSPCYDSFLCSRAKGRSALSFYVYKEVLLSMSAVVLWALAFCFFLLPLSWESVFVLGAVGVFLSLFLDAHK